MVNFYSAYDSLSFRIHDMRLMFPCFIIPGLRSFFADPGQWTWQSSYLLINFRACIDL